LSIFLCPDTPIGANTQSIAYRLDALQAGVRVKVVARLNAVTKELAITTDAHTSDHPTSFESILTTTENAATSSSSNVVDISSSAHLDMLDLDVDNVSPVTGNTNAGHVRISDIPASTSHRFTLEGKEATDLDRTVSVRLALSDTANNPNEGLLIERFDPDAGGKLVGRIDMQDIAKSFDIHVDATLKPEGNVATATPVHATITGAQVASPSQSLEMQQWNGTQLLSVLEASSFASSYTIDVTVLRKTINNQVKDAGGDFFASFPNGAPAGGVMQLSRYRRVDDADILDSRFYFGGFSPETSFHVLAHGDPDDPTGSEINVENSATVSDQLIQVLRYPVNQDPQRFVLAGSTADTGAIFAPVDGRNLRWDSVPKTYDFVTDLTRQPSRVPATITMDVTSTPAMPSGKLEVTEKQTDGTLGFILKAFNSNLHLDGNFQGTLTNPSRARIARDNFGSRPDQALQVYLKDGSNLKTQVRFMGPSATTTGLVSGTGSQVDGVITGIPDTYDYDMSLVTDAQGRPTDATLSGQFSAAAPNMDVHFVDNRKGIELHQHDLPSHFSYVVHAENFDGSGRPQKVRLAATDQTTRLADGVLEAKYRGLHFYMQGLAKTFSYDISVTGGIDNPATATFSQRQSELNPDQLVQLVAEQGGGQRLAVTLRNRGSSVLPESASHMDFFWGGVPKDFDATIGRSLSQDGAHVNVNVDTLGEDVPTASVALRQYRSGQRQELRLWGLAPRLDGTLQYGGSLADPNRLHVDLQSSVRHATDALQMLSYNGSELEANVFAHGGDGIAPVQETATRANATFVGLPAGVTLDYTNSKDGNGNETAFTASVHNKNAAGQDTPNPDGRITLEFKKNGVISRRVTGADLPAALTNLSYTFPNSQPDGNGHWNCLGDIGYNATSSTADVGVRMVINRGCMNGTLIADITDVPSQGFATAEVLRDGSATFLTQLVGATRQSVTKAVIEAPVPNDVADFVNDDVHFGPTQICPEYGKFLGIAVGCTDVHIEANQQYRKLRVRLEAEGLQDAQLKTNVGQNGDAKPYPQGFDDIDEKLWDLLPIFAVRNDGTGTIKAFISGEDDPSVDSNLYQMTRCCLRTWKTSTIEDNFDPDGKPLALRFYGWQVGTGHCGADFDPALAKCNLDGFELTNTRDDNMRNASYPIPFEPRFNAYDASSNGFVSNPVTTTYYVPNLYDIFMSSDAGNGNRSRWFSETPGGIRTDWYFQSLLREYEVDPFDFGA
jgi:hypothetical protein